MELPSNQLVVLPTEKITKVGRSVLKGRNTETRDLFHEEQHTYQTGRSMDTAVLSAVGSIENQLRWKWEREPS